MHRATALIHNPTTIDSATGAASPTLCRASTFHQSSDPPTAASFSYSRVQNPTREVLEATMAQLEHGVEAVAFASGMAAIASVMTLFNPGDHIVVPRDVYGGTQQLLESLVAQGKLSVSPVDMTDVVAVESAIRPNTRALYVETPSNPTLAITDLKDLATLARAHHLIAIADNTFMSPYLQRPLDQGFDLVIHSATKFLGGHSDVLAGIVISGDADWGQRLRHIQIMYGNMLGPDDCWLVMRGLKTLAVRLDRAQDNARRLAQFLASRPEVERVYYPGLPTHPGQALHQRQADGPGAVLSFTLIPTISRSMVVSTLRYALYGVSLGGVETIVSHPASMSHAALTPAQRAAVGVSDQLLRVSVGIEDGDDLVEDFGTALTQAARTGDDLLR